MNEHTSQGLSQRLHDKGFRAEFNYIYDSEGVLWQIFAKDDKHNACAKRLDIQSSFWLVCTDPECKEHDDYTPAYTFTELWGIVPEGFPYKGQEATLDIWKGDGCDGQIEGGMCLKYRLWDTPIMASFHQHESPAEALGLLVLWLIENNYLEVSNENM